MKPCDNARTIQQLGIDQTGSELVLVCTSTERNKREVMCHQQSLIGSRGVQLTESRSTRRLVGRKMEMR